MRKIACGSGYMPFFVTSWAPKVHRASGSGRGKPSAHGLFSRHIISRTQSFQQNRPFNFQARVVLKPLVSLLGRLVACSARISVDTHTHTHAATNRQTNFRNPCCACAPRVIIVLWIANLFLSHWVPCLKWGCWKALAQSGHLDHQTGIHQLFHSYKPPYNQLNTSRGCIGSTCKSRCIFPFVRSFQHFHSLHTGKHVPANHCISLVRAHNL